MDGRRNAGDSGDKSTAQSIGSLHAPIHKCCASRCDGAGQVMGGEHPVRDALSNGEVAVELADLHEIDERRREVDLMFAIGPAMRATLSAGTAVKARIRKDVLLIRSEQMWVCVSDAFESGEDRRKNIAEIEAESAL